MKKTIAKFAAGAALVLTPTAVGATTAMAAPMSPAHAQAVAQHVRPIHEVTSVHEWGGHGGWGHGWGGRGWGGYGGWGRGWGGGWGGPWGGYGGYYPGGFWGGSPFLTGSF